MDRLSGLDASFLYFESDTNLMHVCGLLVLDPATMPTPYGFDALRSVLGERIAGNAMFRRRLHDPLLNIDHPVWVDGGAPDLERHVQLEQLPTPGGQQELAAVCARIAAVPLDRRLPLWQMTVVEGLADDRVAVVLKMHHASVDGVAATELLAQLCSLLPDGPPLIDAPPAVRPPVRDARIVLDGALAVARRPLEAVRLLPATVAVIPEWIGRARAGRAMPAPFSAPRTSFNTAVGPQRSIAFTRLDLAAVKEVKNRADCTVNDVVLAICSGALRRYLDDRGELPAAPLVAVVPVSVHGRSDAPGTNRVSAMFTRLATDVAEPRDRLDAIAAQNRVAKEHHGSLSASLLQDWMQLAAASTLGLAGRLYSRLRLADHHPVIHNLVISNVPGPPVPIHFLGARVVGFHPFGPVFDGAGLNISVLSNDGHLDVGVIACRDQVPDPWSLVGLLSAELDALVSDVRRGAPADAVRPPDRSPTQ